MEALEQQHRIKWSQANYKTVDETKSDWNLHDAHDNQRHSSHFVHSGVSLNVKGQKRDQEDDEVANNPDSDFFESPVLNFLHLLSVLFSNQVIVLRRGSFTALS